MFQTVRDGEPDDFLITTQVYSVWDEGTGSTVAGGWQIDDDGNVTDFSEGYDQHGLSAAKRAREWNERGFFPADIATFSEADSYYKQGRILSRYARMLPGCEGKQKITYGYDINAVEAGRKLISRSSVQSTLTAVSFTSKHPMRALKLIQLMHEDADLLNLLCYGIEGRDYTKDPSNPKRMERESGGYYISEFMIGSQFLAYLVPSYEDGVWEETKAENEAADIDPYIGFSFDRKPVETEISNVSAASDEYSGLSTGLYADYESVYAEKMEKLEKAGYYIIKEEIERQLKDWQDAQ